MKISTFPVLFFCLPVAAWAATGATVPSKAPSTVRSKIKGTVPATKLSMKPSVTTKTTTKAAKSAPTSPSSTLPSTKPSTTSSTTPKVMAAKSTAKRIKTVPTTTTKKPAKTTTTKLPTTSTATVPPTSVATTKASKTSELLSTVQTTAKNTTTSKKSTTSAAKTTPSTTAIPEPAFDELDIHLGATTPRKCEYCSGPKKIKADRAAPSLNVKEDIAGMKKKEAEKKKEEEGVAGLWLIWPILGHLVAIGLIGFLVFQLVGKKKNDDDKKSKKEETSVIVKAAGKPIEEYVLPEDYFKKKGPLHLQNEQRGVMNHLLANEKSHSLKGPLEIDSDLCEDVQIGSDIEVIDGMDITVEVMEGSKDRDTIIDPSTRQSIMLSKKNQGNMSQERRALMNKLINKEPSAKK